jgi:acetolactate synthase regulatory subunit
MARGITAPPVAVDVYRIEAPTKLHCLAAQKAQALAIAVTVKVNRPQRSLSDGLEKVTMAEAALAVARHHVSTASRVAIHSASLPQ